MFPPNLCVLGPGWGCCWPRLPSAGRSATHSVPSPLQVTPLFIIHVWRFSKMYATFSLRCLCLWRKKKGVCEDNITSWHCFLWSPVKWMCVLLFPRFGLVAHHYRPEHWATLVAEAVPVQWAIFQQSGQRSCPSHWFGISFPTQLTDWECVVCRLWCFVKVFTPLYLFF